VRRVLQLLDVLLERADEVELRLLLGLLRLEALDGQSLEGDELLDDGAGVDAARESAEAEHGGVLAVRRRLRAENARGYRRNGPTPLAGTSRPFPPRAERNGVPGKVGKRFLVNAEEGPARARPSSGSRRGPKTAALRERLDQPSSDSASCGCE